MALARSCRALATRLRISVSVQPWLRQQQHSYSMADNESEEERSDMDMPELPGGEETEDEKGEAEDEKGEAVKERKGRRKQTMFSHDPTIYKGILFGSVLDKPLEKIFKNGFSVIVFTLMTGGRVKTVRKNDEERFTLRGLMQRHRICVFKPELVALAKKLKKGTNVYIEGNIETQQFDHPVTGRVTNINELCVRENGCIIIAEKDGFLKMPLS